MACENVASNGWSHLPHLPLPSLPPPLFPQFNSTHLHSTHLNSTNYNPIQLQLLFPPSPSTHRPFHLSSSTQPNPTQPNSPFSSASSTQFTSQLIPKPTITDLNSNHLSFSLSSLTQPDTNHLPSLPFPPSTCPQPLQLNLIQLSLTKFLFSLSSSTHLTCPQPNSSQSNLTQARNT